MLQSVRLQRVGHDLGPGNNNSPAGEIMLSAYYKKELRALREVKLHGLTHS